MTIQNKGPEDKFSLRIFPPFATSGSGQVTTSFDSTTADINTNQNATFQLTFSASACIADYATAAFTITASSIVNPSLLGNATVSVTTLRRFPVCISKVTLSNDTLVPGQTLTITTEIDNPSDLASSPFDLIINIKNSSDLLSFPTVTDHIDIIQAHSSRIITDSYVVPQHVGYGRFNVELVLKNTQTNEVSSQVATFVIQQFENPTAQRSVKFGLLTQDIFLKVRNDGNSVVNASTSETIPSYITNFITFVNKPDSQQTVGSNTVYAWLLYNLQPGEERTIEYQINLWQIVLLVVLLIIAVVYAFTYVFTIRIVKSHKLFGPVAGSKEITITLEIKNRTHRAIHDVYVRDFLPPFATIIERFETIKPSVRKVQGGSELIWKLGTLGSMDERVLTYRIKPAMEILGEIKLPKASIRYSDKNKQLKKVISKSISIKL